MDSAYVKDRAFTLMDDAMKDCSHITELLKIDAPVDYEFRAGCVIATLKACRELFRHPYFKHIGEGKGVIDP